MQKQVNSSEYFANKITSVGVSKDIIILMDVTRMLFKYVNVDTPEPATWRITGKFHFLISDLRNK